MIGTGLQKFMPISRKWRAMSVRECARHQVGNRYGQTHAVSISKVLNEQRRAAFRAAREREREKMQRWHERRERAAAELAAAKMEQKEKYEEIKRKVNSPVFETIVTSDVSDSEDEMEIHELARIARARHSEAEQNGLFSFGV